MDKAFFHASVASIRLGAWSLEPRLCCFQSVSIGFAMVVM
jgi:hypothetical protein